jgi:O-antigen/teichoic acid export membrane protein
MHKQLSKLLSGSALGQLIAFLFIPILTYVFDPVVFGEYQVAFSIAMFTAILLSLKLEIATPTIADEEVQGFVKSVIVVIAMNTLIFSLALIAIVQWTDWLPEALDKPQVLGFTIAISALIALNNTARFLLIEKQAFGTISTTLFMQSGGRSFFQWCSQVASNIGLLLGDLIARCAMLGLVLASKKVSIKTLLSAPVAILQVLKTQWRYPVWVVPSTLLNNSMALLLIPVVSHQFGLVEAGIVAVAYRLITAPNSLIGAAFSDVLFARFSQQVKQNNIKALQRDFAKFSLLFIALSVVGFAIIYHLAPYLAVLVEQEYAASADYLIVLIPWFAAQFAVAPLSRVVFVFNQQALKLVFDLMVALNLVWQVTFNHGDTALVFLTETSMSMAAIYGVYLIILHLIVWTRTESVEDTNG